MGPTLFHTHLHVFEPLLATSRNSLAGCYLVKGLIVPVSVAHPSARHSAVNNSSLFQTYPGSPDDFKGTLLSARDYLDHRIPDSQCMCVATGICYKKIPCDNLPSKHTS